MTSDITRPSQLWKPLPTERKLQAAEAFWRDGEASLEHAEAVALLSQRLKFRAKSVMALPVEKKARHLVAIPVTELLAARMLIAYHLTHQRSMMGSFLDALGIAHEAGVIAEEEAPSPSKDSLLAAAHTIATSYPADDVALYLSTLLWQDPETWGALAEAPQRQPPASPS